MKKALFSALLLAALGSPLSAQGGLWENWLYLGVRLGGSMHYFALSGEYFGRRGLPLGNLLYFDRALQLSIQPFRFFAVQAEVIYTKGESVYSSDMDFLTQGMEMLTLPVLAKFTFQPADFPVARFAVLAGMYFRLPWGGAGIPPDSLLVGYYAGGPPEPREYRYGLSPGFMAGGAIEARLGPGALVADFRYGIDFNSTTIGSARQRPVPVYRRSGLYFSLGYQIGLIRRK